MTAHDAAGHDMASKGKASQGMARSDKAGQNKAEGTSEFDAYAYSYPHKLAYRTFKKAKSLSAVWHNENLKNMMLYLHIPYCEMRCGFCNLLTIANPKSGQRSFIETAIDEMEMYQQQLEGLSFAEYAIGGGTPTFLADESLGQLLAAMDDMLAGNMRQLVGSIECSPKTITQNKLSILKAYDVTRLSMGIQSWLLDETKSLGRPQSPQVVEQAVSWIKDKGFGVLNLDLIYGMKGQTEQSFLYSLEKTVSFQPEEIFLYPLYIREQTGLGKKSIEFADERMALYRFGRDYLLGNGYQQISMRCFRRADVVLAQTVFDGTMNNTIGIGAGARSYTSKMNYSTPYAVNMSSIRTIIDQYSQQSSDQLNTVQHGIELNQYEQKIRFVLKSLIEGGSLNNANYQSRFKASPFDDFPQLVNLRANGLIAESNGMWSLTPLGMELEDMIGPTFYSSDVKQKMRGASL